MAMVPGSTAAATFVWAPGPGLLPREIHDRPLLVADSWLVAEGTVRALDRHRRRFTGSCRDAADPVAEQLDAFWAATVDKLPRTGNWFPRVELAAPGASGQAPELWLRVRPSPPLGRAVRVWVPDVPDPRRQPRVKGPDLGVLGQLREQAVALGAQEALLRTPHGVAVEGVTSNLLWWEGDTLCLPGADLSTLPGVTSGLIEERATALGIPVKQSHRTAGELAECEVWLVNALHGIRPVTGWLTGGSPDDIRPAANAERAGEWQHWLMTTATPSAGQ